MKRFFSIRIGFWLIPAILVSCVGLQPVYKLKGPLQARELIYPYGTYQHAVEITQKNGKTHSFLGIVRIQPDKIEVVGLSPFQTTLFRIREDRKTGVISVDVFQEALKKYQDRLVEVYSLLANVLKAKLNDEQKQLFDKGIREKFPTRLDATGFGKKMDILMGDYDKHQIPLAIEMIHPNFKVEVKVVGYEIG